MKRHTVVWAGVFFLATSVSFFGAATRGLAQVLLQIGAAADPFNDDEDLVAQMPIAGAPVVAASTTSAAATPETERLKKLKALTYDRRPSAILRAWSEPPGSEDEEKKDEKKEEKPAEGEAAGKDGAPIADAAAPAAGAVVTTGVLSITGAATTAPAATAAPAAASTTPAATPAAAAPADTAAAAPAAEPAPATEADKEKAEAAKKAAEEQAKKKAEEEKKKQAELKALEKEMKELQRHVTLGEWEQVKTYLAGIPANEGKEGYAQMVKSLGSPPPPQPGRQPMNAPGIGQTAEQHVFRFTDLIGLAAACPHKFEKESLERLGPIVRQTVQSGTVIDEVVALLKQQADGAPEAVVLSRRQCAQVLLSAGQAGEIGAFLPTLEAATNDKDGEALTLLARHYMAVHGKEHKPETLEQAWAAVQATLAIPGVEKKQQEESLKLATELAPRIRDTLGQKWLEESFTSEPQRGMTILATIGSLTSTALQNQGGNPSERLKALELQKSAVEALLKAAPQLAGQWKAELGLLAHSWLREAEFSRVASGSSMFGPRMQRDVFGNLYFMNDDGDMEMQQPQQQNQARPIAANDIIEAAPNEPWVAQLGDAVQPRFTNIFAQLYLKVGEEDRAYPYIEKLAKQFPDMGRDLVHEFLRVWTKNHDPNASRRYSNPYIFMYGFERKAESIPLTRSKQLRNLAELTKWVERFRALNLKDLDESLFAKAFTNCHSSAEVYQLEDIERVFGKLAGLEPKTLAQLVQQMRQNLAGQWRTPSEQEAKKTRRKQQDIQAEVLRGYAVATAIAADGLKQHPDDWRLLVAQACLAHDENNYRQELSPNPEFSERRLAALGQFARAAELYAKEVPTMREEDQSQLAYEHWFYASLGASDLGQIDHRSTADERQPPLIKAAIEALPGEAADHHMQQFANSLFTRMSALKPTVKFRYLKGGFAIVGDHKQAREARKLYDYYEDLVTEIKLVTRVDGSAEVGENEPFGVFVDLHHTREIERESGGFGRYLQNQNANMYFSYNYGRPTENYRDKFKEAVTTLLSDNYVVESVTFQNDDVHSRAAEEYGWRVTPYAYLLLKPRGPQIDKFPALKMDLDFLDTSGFVVLPINSPALPIDASHAAPDGRPYEKLEIVELLDERQANDGKLIVEVKATARGLVPPLAKLLNTKIDDFELVNVDDQGLSVSRFDPDSAEPVVISERTWMITYAGRKDLAELPKTFTFPTPAVDDAEVTFQRYVDADLATVEPTVSLEAQYGAVKHTELWIAAAAAAGVVVLLLAIVALARRRKGPVAARFQVPEKVNPFTVLALLRDIEARDGLGPPARQELATSIKSIERHYFADTPGDAPNLQTVAEQWVRKAR